jgi:hypothetical protein
MTSEERNTLCGCAPQTPATEVPSPPILSRKEPNVTSGKNRNTLRLIESPLIENMCGESPPPKTGHAKSDLLLRFADVRSRLLFERRGFAGQLELRARSIELNVV